MFLFACCQAPKSGLGYEVRKGKKREFTNDLNEIDYHQLATQGQGVLKIKKSDFEEVTEDLKSNKKKFIDHQFPADDRSLGEIEGVGICAWKRISELITDPVLLGPRVEPSQVIQGSLGDCYFLSALAALAEEEENVRSLFEGQSYNPNGIYKVTMRLRGEVEEVVVDDFIPINEQGQPLFCQPHRNEFWVLILQKAWAKAKGSYANIVMGTPTAVFKALTLAPADVLPVKDKSEERDKLWTSLLQRTQSHSPVVCLAREDVQKGSSIQNCHSYSLIGAAVLEDTEGNYHKVLKLRDPWSKQIWQGGAASSRPFWSKIVASHERKELERKPAGGDQGVFYLPFTDFCSNFSQVHFCLLGKGSNYNYEPLLVNKKNGCLFEVPVLMPGTYSFQLHQSDLPETETAELCRATLLLMRKTNEGPVFVNGVLKYNEEDTVITEDLQPGNYLLFAKIDPTREQQSIPSKTVVNLYGPCFTLLKCVEQMKYPELFREVFLAHGRGSKKNTYNNGLMWISWKLLLQQGGYAYVAMGVDPNSNKKFVIDFSQQEFNRMGFHLKGRFKGHGNQRIEVLPGQEQIIMARVNNQLIKTLKFPPSLGIKMELVPRE